MGRVRGNATYEDLIQVPDIMVAELIDGELYAWPRPARPHARAASRLGMKIGSAFDLGETGPGGWWIIVEPELHFARNVLVPDIGGWKRDRVPEYPDAGKCAIPPDWACEILSPSTARVDRIKKLPIYAAAGVTWVWIIDPVEQTLEVKKLTDGKYPDVALHAGDEKVRIEPFAEIEIDLALIWGSAPAL
jgi:Uma2 family endonuclease